MNELTSIASLQTKGLKRHFQEEESATLSSSKLEHLSDEINGHSSSTLNCVSGSKKRKALIKAGLWKKQNETMENSNLNVVGFEVFIMFYFSIFPYMGLLTVLSLFHLSLSVEGVK